ncbi:MAG: O-antigen ligase family protein [Thiohalomonadaceae bacterium]
MRNRAQEAKPAPFVGLVIFWFGMEYLRPQDYIGIIGVLRPGLILLVIMALVWLLRAEKSALKDNLIIGYIVFLALGLLSVPFARNNYWALMPNVYMTAALVGGVLPVIAFINRPDALRRLFWWWVLFHAIVAVVGILNGGRGSGSFMGDENDLALTLAMAMPFAYFLATLDKRARMKAFFIIAGLLLVAGIVATRSRGGFLGMMMATVGIILFSRNRVRNLVGVAILAAAAAFVLMQSGLTDPPGRDRDDPRYRQRHEQSYWDEMRSIQDATDATRRSRLYLWGRAWEMFLDNPLFGVGTSNFPWRVQDYEVRDPNFVGDVRFSGGRVAHTLYFTFLAEYGLVGSTVWVLLAIGIVTRLRKARQRLEGLETDDAKLLMALARACSAGLLAFLVSGAFLTVNYYPHFWYLIGFAIAIDRTAAALQPVTEAGRAFRGRRVRQNSSRPSPA